MKRHALTAYRKERRGGIGARGNNLPAGIVDIREESEKVKVGVCNLEFERRKLQEERI